MSAGMAFAEIIVSLQWNVLFLERMFIMRASVVYF